MNIERLKEKALEEFYPSEDELEETRKKYRKIADFIEEEFGRETHFAGSSSRGTCMKGDRDIDVFVLFPEDAKRQKLEDEGLRIGKKVFEKFNEEYHVEYAEHPYTKGEINGHEVEIVPCYDVGPENIQSAVDRTPHHSLWVQENLDQQQRKDVVLLKLFLRSQGIYGSSLKTRGFSGYLCEALIAEYGSFENLVREAVKWREKEVIDPEDHHGELPEELEEKFSNANLVVIDPVDPERNVASVLSRENYSRFIFNCWRFRNSPGINFFREEEREFSEFELKQEVQGREEFLVVEFDSPEEVDDIVYPQMRKALRRLEKKFRRSDFRTFESGFFVGEEKTRIFFEVQPSLPEVTEKRGPKVFHGEDHLAQFTGKYENVYVKNDRLYAKVEREYKDAKQFLKDFLSGDLREKGIPGNVAEKLGEYRLVDPMEGGDKWLKYLAEKLHVGGR